MKPLSASFKISPIDVVVVDGAVVVVAVVVEDGAVVVGVVVVVGSAFVVVVVDCFSADPFRFVLADAFKIFY